ncbi:MAG TPA: phosphatidate cytidylyltransferase [Rhodanobacteraceae bacterium]|nr:phosphatidate cytidylyltransferase [Rhodanobacteraceae bacterium]
MLLQRILTALILTPLAVVIILFPPTWLFTLIVAIVFLGAQWEWTRLCGLETPAARTVMPVLSLIAMALLWWQRDVFHAWLAVLVIGFVWWLSTLAWLRTYTFAASPSREHAWLKLLVSLLVLVPAWAALTYLHGTALRGPWWTLLALCIVWAADIGAYFSGRAFGKRKLAPRISPGKTRAGAWGALVAGMLVAVAGGWLLGIHDGRLVGMAVLGLVTVAASIVGDLFESLMKRHADIKDSSAIFPGHGGLLDRLDSVFAALPVFVLGKLVLGL